MLPRPSKVKPVTQLSDLSPDLIFNILTRVPAASLTRAAKFTCKLWHSIVTDPVFADCHLKRFLNHPPGHLYTFSTEGSSSLYFANDDPAVSIELPGHLGDRYNYTSLASSRGLMTYTVVRDHSIYVCNPITADRVKLPTISKVEAWGFGFGYAPLADKYKYVQCFTHEKNRNLNDACIFTLGDKSWRQLAVPRQNSYPKPSNVVCCNGVLYWYCDSEYNIMSFDLDNEEFRTRRIPNRDASPDFCSSYLTKLGETVTFVIMTEDYMQEVWMLVDESEDFWVEKYCFSLPTFKVDGREIRSLSFKLIGFWENRDLLGIETCYDRGDVEEFHEFLIPWKIIKSYNANSQTYVVIQLPLPDDMVNNACYQTCGVLITHFGSLISPSKIAAATID